MVLQPLPAGSNLANIPHQEYQYKLVLILNIFNFEPSELSHLCSYKIFVTNVSLLCSYQIVVTKLSHARTLQIIISKLSLPNYQMPELTRLLFPNCRYQIIKCPNLTDYYFQIVVTKLSNARTYQIIISKLLPNFCYRNPVTENSPFTAITLNPFCVKNLQKEMHFIS